MSHDLGRPRFDLSTEPHPGEDVETAGGRAQVINLLETFHSFGNRKLYVCELTSGLTHIIGRRQDGILADLVSYKLHHEGVS